MSRKSIVVLGGVEYTVLPLNWESLEECQGEIVLIQKGSGNFFEKEQREAMFKVIVSSLRRANPDLDPVEVKKWLDIENIPHVLQVVFTATFPTETDEGGDPEGAGKGKGGVSKT